MRAFWGVLLVALLLRGGFVVYRHWTVPASRAIQAVPDRNDDQLDYHTTATNILAGNGFRSSDLGGSLYVSEPAYPLFVAAMYALTGGSLLATKLAQVLLATGTCAVVYLAAKREVGVWPATCGAALLAIHPAHVYYPAFLLSESLKVFVITTMVVLCLRALRTATPVSALMAGAAIGAGAMTRIVVLPFLPFFACLFGFTLRPRHRALLGAGLALLAGSLVLVPWSIRNYVRTGVFSPVRSDAATMLVVAADPVSSQRLTDGVSVFREALEGSMLEETRQARERVGSVGVERGAGTVARLYFRRLREDPAFFASLIFARLTGLWKLYPYGGEFAQPAVQAASLVANVIMIGFGLAGVFWPGFLPRQRLALAALVILFTLVHLMYHGVPMRYRMPVEPCLILLASPPMAAILRWAKGVRA